MAVANYEYFLQGQVDGCPLLQGWGVERTQSVRQNYLGVVHVYNIDYVVCLQPVLVSSLYTSWQQCSLHKH